MSATTKKHTRSSDGSSWNIVFFIFITYYILNSNASFDELLCQMKKYKTRVSGDVKGVSHGALSSRLLKREREREVALITFSKQPAPHISLLRLAISKGAMFFEIFHFIQKEVKTYSNLLPWKGGRLNADSLERAPKTFSNSCKKVKHNTARSYFCRLFAKGVSNVAWKKLMSY
jgi:hypothetical protein